MDILKKFFPLSFREKKDVAALVLYAIIHIAVAAVLSILAFFLVWIPFIGILFGLIFGLADLYVLLSLVLTFLDFFKILEKKFN